MHSITSQPAFACLKLTIETLEQDVNICSYQNDAEQINAGRVRAHQNDQMQERRDSD